MLHLIVAHAGEAAPLVRFFHLRRLHDIAALPVYQGEEVRLFQSGAGRVAAAAAVGFAAGRFDAAGAAWLNVGLAGHRDRDIGAALLADTVVDAESGEAWYPQLVFEPGCPSGRVTTVARPEHDYPRDSAYDLEASGFVAAAARHATLELVHCLKIVSDNAAMPVTRFSRDAAADLVAAALDVLAGITAALQELSAGVKARLEDPPGYEVLLARFRFSATERAALRRLLARRAALVGDASAADAAREHCRSGREVLDALDRELERLAP
jgi:hypothetical protein